MRPTGPNVKKLICARVAQLAIPDGGGLADGIGFLADKDRLLSTVREATQWVFNAVDAVRAAPDCRLRGDEAIAGEIVKELDEAKR